MSIAFMEDYLEKIEDFESFVNQYLSKGDPSRVYVSCWYDYDVCPPCFTNCPFFSCPSRSGWKKQKSLLGHTKNYIMDI